jgi:hypothetical protein
MTSPPHTAPARHRFPRPRWHDHRRQQIAFPRLELGLDELPNSTPRPDRVKRRTTSTTQEDQP